jgi:hypothetical protein
MGCRNSVAEWGKRALAWYFRKCCGSCHSAKAMYSSYTHLNFPNSCSSIATSFSISLIETPVAAGLDSMKTSNYSEVFADEDITSVSSNLMNEDGKTLHLLTMKLQGLHLQLRTSHKFLPM